MLLAAALVAQGRSRIAWGLIGAGVLCWGLGEVVWIIQAQVGKIPYPGIADFFYVAGYPLIFFGVILHPYLRPGRFERIRLAIDATAGTLSLAVVMWVAYLHEVVELGTNPVETFLNVTYPLGDVLLVTALMVLAMRRSEQRLDMRIILLAGGVALTAVETSSSRSRLQQTPTSSGAGSTASGCSVTGSSHWRPGSSPSRPRPVRPATAR